MVTLLLYPTEGAHRRGWRVGLVHSVVGTAANVADVTRSTSCCMATSRGWAATRVIPASTNVGARRPEGRLADCRPSQHLQEAGQAQRAVQGQAQDRTSQSSGAREGRTSVSSDQTPVRLCEDALPWSGEKHRSVGDTVRAVEPVDGAKTFDECRRGAPVMGIAAARSSQRLKPRNERVIGRVLIDLPLSKSARAEVGQKQAAFSDLPSYFGCLSLRLRAGLCPGTH